MVPLCKIRSSSYCARSKETGRRSQRSLRLLGPPRPSEPLPGLEELGLDRTQRATAKLILEKHRPELEAILAEVEPRLRPIRDTVESELRRDVLTDSQAKRLEELKKGGRRPPGAGGP